MLSSTLSFFNLYKVSCYLQNWEYVVRLFCQLAIEVETLNFLVFMFEILGFAVNFLIHCDSEVYFQNLIS